MYKYEHMTSISNLIIYEYVSTDMYMHYYNMFMSI